MLSSKNRGVFQRAAGIATLALALSSSSCSNSGFNSASGGAKKSPPTTAQPQSNVKGTKPDNQPTKAINAAIPPKPRFAMLVNDLKCGMCHVTINGDVASTASVSDWSPTHMSMYQEVVQGTWFVAGTFTTSISGQNANITATQGVKQNYSGPEIPKGGFPNLDMGAVAKVAKGSVTAANQQGTSVKIDGVANGNTVLNGSSSPIQLNGEVLVNGDAVIYGTFKGVGTLYASGNIYIPSSLKAQKSAFPFPSDRAAAEAQAGKSVADPSIDGLGLAAGGAIIIGDPNTSLFTDSKAPAGASASALNAGSVNGWFSGYSSLVSKDCGSPFTIDAFMYARKAIAGHTNPWLINGGIITDTFHWLGGGCGTGGFNGAGGPNTINYDYRLRSGIKILSALDAFFL